MTDKEKELFCPFNQYVECGDKTKCDRCGWNDKNTLLRQVRILKVIIARGKK